MHTITVQEATEVAEVSDKAIYKAISDGKIIKVEDSPIRLSIESVLRYGQTVKRKRGKTDGNE